MEAGISFSNYEVTQDFKFLTIWSIGVYAILKSCIMAESVTQKTN